MSIIKLLKSERGELVSAFLVGLGTSLTGGAATGGAAGAIGGAAVAATAASVGSSIAGAVKKPPEMKVVAPPSPVKGEEAAAAMQSKRIQGLGYRSTILSNSYQQAQQQYLKQKLGQ